MASSRCLFADCTLDRSARELRRAGARIDLPPTVFDCIAYLIEHRERAVGPDELVAAEWGRTEVSDTMLGKAILAARRAVGETAEAQALLRTVPQFGHHWVGETSAEPASVVEPPKSIAAEAAPAVSFGHAAEVSAGAVESRSRAISLLAIALLLIGIGAIAMFAYRPAATSRVVDAGPSIGIAFAVLSAEVVTEASEDWLRLGLMDLIATRLRNAGIRAARRAGAGTRCDQRHRSGGPRTARPARQADAMARIHRLAGERRIPDELATLIGTPAVPGTRR